MTSAKIIADSVNPDGQRITSFITRYPRYVHSEILTHRALSRNAGSSRAIPIERMIKDVTEDPVIPAQWGRNQSGMQSMELLSSEEATDAEALWLASLGDALRGCTALSEAGVHKQWANRVLEAWMHITVLVTATEWGNFFNLRAHPAAHPDFQQLAYRMLWAYKNSTPDKLTWGEWHLPFGEKMPTRSLEIDRSHEEPSIHEKLKISTARSARISYLTHDGEFAPAKDFGLHDRLIGPGHWSPFEHAAKAEPTKPDYWDELKHLIDGEGQEHLTALLDKDLHRDQGNYRGWTPYRKQFSNENKSEMNIDELLSSKPEWITLDPA